MYTYMHTHAHTHTRTHLYIPDVWGLGHSRGVYPGITRAKSLRLSQHFRSAPRECPRTPWDLHLKSQEFWVWGSRARFLGFTVWDPDWTWVARGNFVKNTFCSFGFSLENVCVSFNLLFFALKRFCMASSCVESRDWISVWNLFGTQGLWKVFAWYGQPSLLLPPNAAMSALNAADFRTQSWGWEL